MTSVIHYRFKNTTEPFSTLTFEGQSIPLSTLKQLISQHKHLHKQSAHDFDLVVADAQTGDEYVKDDERIGKNVQVVVRRVPNTKAKTITTHIAPDTEQSVHSAHSDVRGGAVAAAGSRSVADRLVLSVSGVVRSAVTASPATSSPAAVSSPAVALPVSSAAPLQQSTGSSRTHRQPPPGYFCKRCGSPDHFVQHCPHFPTPPSSFTNNNATRPSAPTPTPAQPTAPTASGPPSDLLCPLCHNLYHNPMVVPCCFTSFCDECIRQALLWEDGYTCPSCQHRPVRLDELRPNDGLKKRVEEWIASREQGQADHGTDTRKAAADERDGAGEADSGSTAPAAAEDDVSVILAEPSAGQLAHQAKRDKQQRCFHCGEPGHRAANCPNRQQQQPTPQAQQPAMPLPMQQQPPMHDPYMANGYGGAAMYGRAPYNDLGMQPYGMGPMGYGGMPMAGMGPSVPMYDDWGNFVGMQPMPMAQQPFYNQQFMPMPAGPVGGGMMGVPGAVPQMGPMGLNGPLTADREADGGVGGGWQHRQFMQHGDSMQQSPANTAPVREPHKLAVPTDAEVETASSADAAETVAATRSASPSPAPQVATSSLLAVMPFVPPRSPPSSPPTTAPSNVSAALTAAVPSPVASASPAGSAAAPSAASSSSPSPSISPPAATHATPTVPIHNAPSAAVPAAPIHSVVSYAYLPSTWNYEPRPLLLCLLSNHLRTLYAPSALLGSAFRLTQQLTTTPLYRVTADNVPPKGNKSSLLLTREGMVEWKRREGEGSGVAMAEDWKGRGGGWEKVVEWMRGERQVRLVKVGEEWKEEETKVEAVAKADDSKERDKNSPSETDRRGGKRKVQTDSQGRLQIKVQRRDQSATITERDREEERRREDRPREREQERQRTRDESSAESDDRRKKRRGGRREREKRERREERQAHHRDNDSGSGTQQQSQHRRRDEGERKRAGEEGKRDRVVVDRKQEARDDDRYRPPAQANDENDVFAMVMQQQ